MPSDDLAGETTAAPASPARLLDDPDLFFPVSATGQALEERRFPRMGTLPAALVWY